MTAPALPALYVAHATDALLHYAAPRLCWVNGDKPIPLPTAVCDIWRVALPDISCVLLFNADVFAPPPATRGPTCLVCAALRASARWWFV